MQTKPHEYYLVIYFNEEKTSFQIIHPTDQFNGDWKGLAEAISHSDDHSKGYHSFEVR